ncbi:aspartyl protease family protein [Candidatus Woesearchaeota archaeon]|nr:aspartyl protease family protein [Candidatus Woesearchaeota archaeon]
MKTPSIPVVFKGKETFETIALLDSGADISAMPSSVAEILGLDLKGKRTPAYGIGGKVDSVEVSVNVLVEKGHEKYNFNMPVKVILGNYDFPILLGRAGFFSKFVVSFDQSQEKVTLKKITREIF